MECIGRVYFLISHQVVAKWRLLLDDHKSVITAIMANSLYSRSSCCLVARTALDNWGVGKERTKQLKQGPYSLGRGPVPTRKLLTWRAGPCLPGMISVMAVDCVHVYTSRWKCHQHAAKLLLPRHWQTVQSGRQAVRTIHHSTNHTCRATLPS